VIVGVGVGVLLGVGVVLGVGVGPNIVLGGRLHAPKMAISHRTSSVFLKSMMFLILANDWDVNLGEEPMCNMVGCLYTLTESCEKYP